MPNLFYLHQLLKHNLSALSEESDAIIADLDNQVKQLQNELTSERENGYERRRQMKVYLETLTKEKAELEKELSTASANLLMAKKIDCELEERIRAEEDLRLKEEEKREQEAARYEGKLKKMEQAIVKAKEASDAAIEEMKILLQRKDEELAMVRDEQAQRLNSTTKRSEEMQGHLMAAEAEKAEHKAKRLAARSEMINMAQALEEVTEAARTVDVTLQYTLLPRAIEQIALLEYTIAQVDEAARSLTRSARGGNDANVGNVELRPLNRRSSSGRWIPLGGGGSLPNQPEDPKQTMSGIPLLAAMDSDNGRAGDDEKEDVNAPVEGGQRRNSWSKGLKLLPSERVDQLNNEMDRVSAGLNLLGQSVERLHEAVGLANQNVCTKLMGDFMRLFGDQRGRNGYTGVSLEEPSALASPSPSGPGALPRSLA